MKELMKKFAGEESGQGLVEYALIVVLIAVVAIGALRILGGKVNGIFENIGSELETSAAAGGGGEGESH